ncbi:5-formyltetrahydrofolate cyclo-ligase [Amedibacterium intestinale]|uniref:5-formyltetrahydrofolate cyclo-ligase n=1 Tax=Amedibacterium intestinale TaxID=2583452 RepID=A0A6N4TGN2_9FIRM|nr:5-formyltetrahydrofolate cyclo-ligase [Amedibacterium intestinale]BBK21909.1 5-formyltetrahydrofolate cyclo-ligase [Amedibacterium intestinale]BBK62017.1 5-formyltetrahydrofolate cyclo-ligase [Amedibacterium intestinale]
MDKKEIRKEKLYLRNQLSTAKVEIYSENICKKLTRYLHGTVGLYKSIRNEVIVDALACYADVVAYPKTLDEETIAFYETNIATNWKKGSFGVLEPLSEHIVQPVDFDVIIVPLVAFDIKGNRLGYGKGYYDRYLKHTHALRIGVGYECQKVDTLITESHDFPLDMIVSEQKIYDFRK